MSRVFLSLGPETLCPIPLLGLAEGNRGFFFVSVSEQPKGCLMAALSNVSVKEIAL